MKKLVLMLAVAFSVSLFSCGGNAEKAECCDSCKQDSTPAVEQTVDSTVVDSTVVDSTVVNE